MLFLIMFAFVVLPSSFICSNHGVSPAICSDFKAIQLAVQLYQLDQGELPKKMSQLVDGERAYLAEWPMDPWGNKYAFFLNTEDVQPRYFLVSYGADGALGGNEADSDWISGSTFCPR